MSLNKNKSFHNESHGWMRVTVAHIPGKRGYSGADELKVDPAIIVQTTQALEGFSGTPESALTRPDVAARVPVTHKIHTLRE